MASSHGLLLLCCALLACCAALPSVLAEELPSESQCRPYIEKALKDLGTPEAATSGSASEEDTTPDVQISDEPYTDAAGGGGGDDDSASAEEGQVAEAAEGDAAADDDSSSEVKEAEGADESADSGESNQTDDAEGGDSASDEQRADEAPQDESVEEEGAGGRAKRSLPDAEEQEGDSKEQDSDSKEQGADSKEQDGTADDENASKEDTNEDDSKEVKAESTDDSKEGSDSKEDTAEDTKEESAESNEGATAEAAENDDSKEDTKEDDSKEDVAADDDDSKEEAAADDSKEDTKEDDSKEETTGADDGDSKEETAEDSKEDSKEQEATDDSKEDSKEQGAADDSKEDSKEQEAANEDSKEEAPTADGDDSKSEEAVEETVEAVEAPADSEATPAAAESEDSHEEGGNADTEESKESNESDSNETAESAEESPVVDLLLGIEIPDNLRNRDHVNLQLRLDEDSTEGELLLEKSSDVILRELKRLYDNAIQPLEILYKYRDLSNRHFGDPEIFSKPLVLFMGPWSGGKSSLINYLTDNEFTEWSLRTGAEPSPAYFNILMHGSEPEVLDGTQLAADWTFSGLQKFGQGLEERLRGLKLPNKLLERVNIVEIPGILEVRKQVSRVFPFNDACQWFIDRADVIFLVYDPSKLDVGPETEAILDQLKGRESQTRILLNKADQVKPEELMRVQGALIWNISPLMSSAQPPVMYTTSLWSMPYEQGSPARLLQSQEVAFLKDLRSAIDKRVENKIASARRFAVRVRNHAKMVDCYLTTYYNHKTIFGNKKLVAEAIIEHPQNYHIYEGLSTLTNISRYDLPDPETYRDFFRLNPLYEFQQLSATCTYFRGCPINRLDVAIAYDLPELVGKYKKMVETATPQGMPKS